MLKKIANSILIGVLIIGVLVFSSNNCSFSGTDQISGIKPLPEQLKNPPGFLHRNPKPMIPEDLETPPDEIPHKRGWRAGKGIFNGLFDWIIPDRDNTPAICTGCIIADYYRFLEEGYSKAEAKKRACEKWRAPPSYLDGFECWLYQTPHDAEKGIRPKDRCRRGGDWKKFYEFPRDDWREPDGGAGVRIERNFNLRCLDNSWPNDGLPRGIGKYYRDARRHDPKSERWDLIWRMLVPDKGWGWRPGQDSNQESWWFGSSSDAWKPYESVDLSSLKGRPVVFWFTAKWCLSCKAQSKYLTNEQVIDFAEAHGITLVKVDLTDATEQMKKELAKYDRAGLPVYAFIDSEGRISVLDWGAVSSEIDILNEMQKLI